VEKMQRHAPSPLRGSVVLVAALFALSACTSGPTITTGTDALPGASTVAPTTPPPLAGGGSCTDLSPVTRTKRGLEVEGRMRGGEPFYALFDGAPALRAGPSTTVYWRLQGARSVRVLLIGANDRIVRITGLHPGLPPYPWPRHGDAWVGTITFPQPGCWRIYIARSDTDGEMWVRAG
jgi:hypothetical protein